MSSFTSQGDQMEKPSSRHNCMNFLLIFIIIWLLTMRSANLLTWQIPSSVANWKDNCCCLYRLSSRAGPLAELLSEKVTSKQKLFNGGYSWEETDSPSFFPGRHADVFVKGQRIGEFGIIHPTVLQKFDIPNPVTALEINIEPFCFDQLYQPLQTHMSQWVMSKSPLKAFERKMNDLDSRTAWIELSAYWICHIIFCLLELPNEASADSDCLLSQLILDQIIAIQGPSAQLYIVFYFVLLKFVSRIKHYSRISTPKRRIKRFSTDRKLNKSQKQISNVNLLRHSACFGRSLLGREKWCSCPSAPSLSSLLLAHSKM